MKADSSFGLVSMAGWLIADVFLVLSIAFLGGVAPERRAATQTPTPTPAVNCRSVFETIPFVVYAGGQPAGAPPTNAALRAALLPLQGKRAGLVLTFGHSPTSDINAGTRLATDVNERLQRAIPEVVDRDTVMRPFLGFADPPLVGQVRIEVQTVVTRCD